MGDNDDEDVGGWSRAGGSRRTRARLRCNPRSNRGGVLSHAGQGSQSQHQLAGVQLAVAVPVVRLLRCQLGGWEEGNAGGGGGVEGGDAGGKGGDRVLGAGKRAAKQQREYRRPRDEDGDSPRGPVGAESAVRDVPVHRGVRVNKEHVACGLLGYFLDLARMKCPLWA